MPRAPWLRLKAKDAGAQATIILIHDSAAELEPVAKPLAALGVRAVFGGHIYQPEMQSGIVPCVPHGQAP